MLNKSEKLFFVAFATLVIIAFLPLNASAQTRLDLVIPQQTSSLTKYLTHVNVTQTVWQTGGWNFSNGYYNPEATSAPTTNHILFVAKDPKPYEALGAIAAVVDGLVIVPIDTGHSIYGNGTSSGAGLYAFDENTGNIIWSYPGISGTTYVFDNTHMLVGTTMINPNNGQFLYKVPQAMSTYAPDLKINFVSGTGPLGTGDINAYSWANMSNPKLLWTSAYYEITAGWAYDNGRLFFGGRNQYEVDCVNATTGAVLWTQNVPDYITSLTAGYGNLYAEGWSGACCLSQATGKILWTSPMNGREASAYCLAYGMYYEGESNIALYALNATTGQVVWSYEWQRPLSAVFPAGGSNESNSAVTWGSTLSAGGGEILYSDLLHTAYGVMLPPNWKSADGLMWNPNPWSVIAQCGESDFVTLNAYYGSAIWRCGVAQVGSPGPCFGVTGQGMNSIVADGNIYGINTVYSGHVSFGDTYSMFIQPQQFINFLWYEPALWCFGKGPTQFNSIAVSTSSITSGQSVTVSGILSDLSPPISSISICSTYSRAADSPATNVPVILSYVTASGGTYLTTVTTNSNGQFSYTFYPTATGSVVIQSQGSASYNAPDTTYTTTIQVSGSSSLTTLVGFAIFATVVAIAVPVIVYKPEPEP